MDQINEMFECPKLYLIDYFDTVKAKIDIEFDLKTQYIRDMKLKEETIKKWIKLIELTEECFNKCLNNKIPIEIINKTKKSISILESSKADEHVLKMEILRIKSKLENYLLSNDSYLVVLINTPKTKYYGRTKIQDDIHIPNLPHLLENRDREKIVLVEEGFTPIEIEYLKERRQFELITEEFENPSFNFIKMKLILDAIKNKIQNIIYIEPFRNLKDLKLVFNEFHQVKCNYIAGKYKLNPDFFKHFINLTNLSIFWVMLEKNSFVNLVNLTSLTFYRTDTHISQEMLNGLKNLETLDLSNNLNLILDAKCFSSLSKLKNLILRNCRLKILEKITFYGLENLETLNLSENNYQKLITDPNWENRLGFEADFFSIFPILKRLEISKSRLFQFKKNVFSELSHLEDLVLNGSKTKCEDLLELGCFNGLKNLKQLNLRSCSLDELEKDIFVNLTSLERLDLSLNKNICFKSGCFNGLTNLKFLHLEECNLKKFKKEVFSCLTNLETIFFNSNANFKFKLSYLPRLKKLYASNSCSVKLENDTFNNCEYLEELGLNSVRYIKLESDCFSMLKNLKTLILFGCNLKLIRKNSLNGLENLEKLDLSFNRELALEDGCLDALLKLKELNLSKCCQFQVKHNSSAKLNCLSPIASSRDEKMLYKLDILNNLSQLRKLNLSFCRLKVLKKNVFLNLINLESLELNCNTGVCFEDGCFNGLTRLKVLNMSSKFYFDQGYISKLNENIFCELHSLETLNLSWNKCLIFELGCLKGLSELRKLYLSQCNIDSLKTEIFNDLNNLELLDLSGNRSICLDCECFKRLSKLKELFLINCNLNEIELNMFAGLESLEKLCLDRNCFKVLDMSCLKELKNLKYLSLENTNLNTLNRNIFYGLENLESIVLSDNFVLDFKS